MITMIIVLSVLGALVLAAAVAFALAFFSGKREMLDDILNSSAFVAFCGVTFADFVALAVLSILAISANAYVEERRAQYEAEREVLAYRLENRDKHIVEDLELYDDILEFNSNVVYAREYADDPWIGLYVDKAWLGIEEIEL